MAEIGEIYPGTGERVVGKIANPNGPGFYLQGEYGGVFAEGGAPYLGSYFDPNMAQHRNDPNRRFTGIEAIAGGGYRSITSNPAEAGYAFNPAAPVGGGATTPTPLTDAQKRAASPEGTSAKGTLAKTLADYGLPASLVNTLWDDWYVNKSTPIGQILIDLEGTTEFKTRFPGLTALKERRNRGEAVQIPSVAEYTQLETGISQVLRDAGLPPGFYDDPSDFATFIGGSVSPKEVQNRIEAGRSLLYDSPVETRQELDRVYGLDEGEAIAFILDPQKGWEQVQKTVRSAGVGGASRRSGFGLLTQQEMEQLAGSGITEAAVAQRGGELVPQAGLFAETVGETTAGEDLGRETQIGYLGGQGTAEAAMERRRKSRAAGFQGGGGAATGGAGKTGLG
jgi:hypothetical protein